MKSRSDLWRHGDTLRRATQPEIIEAFDWLAGRVQADADFARLANERPREREPREHMRSPTDLGDGS